MISLIFIVGFFSLLLLPITCISILFSLQPDHHHNNHSAAATSATKPHLSSIWRLLVHHTMFPDMNYAGAGFSSKAEMNDGGRRSFAGRRDGGEKEECRVCLCEVEEGEEISDLRCNHVFHKVCLDAWVGSGHATCPLCRGRVFSPSVAEGGAAELLMFQFSSLGSSRQARREGSWWLR